MRSSSSASALFSKISAPRPPSVHELKRRRSSAEPDAAAIRVAMLVMMPISQASLM